ncbi:hypothetical protein [Streptomyces sp. NPDC126514]|uniref:hypothetical protein n=1 Tax=Streptomyces sp. NPDC126514 TaxID=3155210 RepID=UPI003316C955
MNDDSSEFDRFGDLGSFADLSTALGELKRLADLVGYDFDEGMKTVSGSRDTTAPCGPYTFEYLVKEITAHAYATVDRVREAFNVPLPYTA